MRLTTDKLVYRVQIGLSLDGLRGSNWNRIKSRMALEAQKNI